MSGAELGHTAATASATVPATAAAGLFLSDRQQHRQHYLNQLKSQVQRWLVDVAQAGGGGAAAAGASGERLRVLIDNYLARLLAHSGTPLSRAERVRLTDAVIAELLAYGPIDPLLHDESVSEVMVNGPRSVWVERNGLLEETDVQFEDDEHVRRIIERIVLPLGRRIDESSPMVDARLPDGSRVNAIIPPLSLVGPALTIRKFPGVPLTVGRLVELGTLTAPVCDFLAACVRGALNILVSGGTGSGKTTLLNVLSSFIPEGERIITLEDAAELRLRQRHVLPLEARPANAEGAGAVPIRQLLRNALRMRPDRIVVGECRGAEALDMLQAMNTGHDGSMTTLHANSAHDALARLETMVLMAGTDLPLRAIREQIGSAIKLVVQTERLPDGSRRIVEIAEVQGVAGDEVRLSSVFRFVHTGREGQRLLGHLAPMGTRPRFLDKLASRGIVVPEATFQPAVPGEAP